MYCCEMIISHSCFHKNKFHWLKEAMKRYICFHSFWTLTFFVFLSVHKWACGNCSAVSLLLGPAEDECGDGGLRGALCSSFHERLSRDGGEPLPTRNGSDIGDMLDFWYLKIIILQQIMFICLCQWHRLTDRHSKAESTTTNPCYHLL